MSKRSRDGSALSNSAPSASAPTSDALRLLSAVVLQSQSLASLSSAAVAQSLDAFVAWRSAVRILAEQRSLAHERVAASAVRVSEAQATLDSLAYESALLRRALHSLISEHGEDEDEGEGLEGLEREIRRVRALDASSTALSASLSASEAELNLRTAKRQRLDSAWSVLRASAAPLGAEITASPALGVHVSSTSAAALAAPLARLSALLALSGADVAVSLLPCPALSSPYGPAASAPLALSVRLRSVRFTAVAHASLFDVVTALPDSPRDEAALSALVAGDDGAALTDARVAYALPALRFDVRVAGRAFRWLQRLCGVLALPPPAPSVAPPVSDEAEALLGHELLAALLSRLH